MFSKISNFLFLLVFYFSISNFSQAIEPDVFVQSTVNRASLTLSKDISKKEKMLELQELAKDTVDIKGIGFYTLGKYRKEISDDLFAYCLLDYLRGSENNKAVPFSEILYGPKSPGKVFSLSENSLVQKLEQFVNNYSEYFEFESTAGMSTLFELKELQVEMKDLLNNIFINAS